MQSLFHQAPLVGKPGRRPMASDSFIIRPVGILALEATMGNCSGCVRNSAVTPRSLYLLRQ